MSNGGTGRPGSERGLLGPADIDDDQMLTLDGGARPWRRPPRDSRTPRPPKVSPGVEAAVAAVAGLLGLPGLGQLQRQALLGSGTSFVVGLVLSVTAAFAVAAALHRWLGGGRRRDAGAVGLVAALLAGTAWGAIAMSGSWGLWQYLPPRIVLWAAALAGIVLAVRTSGVGARLASGFAGVTAGIAVMAALQTGWPLLPSYLPAPPVPVAAPVGESAEATPSLDGSAQGEDLAEPTFGDLCHPDELEVATTVPVPGGNDVAATLTATNVGGRECRVEGWPSLPPGV